jgi:hypothetical protein
VCIPASFKTMQAPASPTHEKSTVTNSITIQLSKALASNWSSDGIWPLLDAAYIAQIPTAWGGLEPPVKMRSLLACLGAKPAELQRAEQALRVLLDEADTDTDEWVLTIAGLVRSRLFGSAKPVAQLDKIMTSTVSHIASTAQELAAELQQQQLHASSSSKNGDSIAAADWDAVTAAADTPYFYPLELQYLSKKLQPPVERFANKHFAVSKEAAAAVTLSDELQQAADAPARSGMAPPAAAARSTDQQRAAPAGMLASRASIGSGSSSGSAGMRPTGALGGRGSQSNLLSRKLTPGTGSLGGLRTGGAAR